MLPTRVENVLVVSVKYEIYLHLSLINTESRKAKAVKTRLAARLIVGRPLFAVLVVGLATIAAIAFAVGPKAAWQAHSITFLAPLLVHLECMG